MINVKSEIGTLKKVLLHRPGVETEMLTPNTFEELLFDDSYYLKVAQEEHDTFANTFKNNGVEVLYIEDLAAEVLEDEKLRGEFIAQFIDEAGIRDQHIIEATTKYLNSFDNVRDMVIKMMAGVRYTDIEAYRTNGSETLFELALDEVFVLQPLPNLVFTRDPFASIHNGVSLHHMASETRSRESIFSQYAIAHHPEFKGATKFYDRTLPTTLEGGDVMILNDEAIAVGLSVRTQAESIETLAKNVFKDSDIKTVYAVDIPKGRA
jgi:arginine deiminase